MRLTWPMKIKNAAVVLLALVALAACSQTQEEWGGYTQSEVKDVLKDPQFKDEILRSAPPDPRGPIHLLYPSNEQIDDADLNKVTIQGDEAWEYKNQEAEWCIYMWEDKSTRERMTQIGPCVAD